MSNSCPKDTGIITNKILNNTIVGVYIFANLLIKVSVFDFLSLELSINSIIFCAVDVLYVLVVFIFNILFKFTHPLNTTFPVLTFLLIDSPVRDDVSSFVVTSVSILLLSALFTLSINSSESLIFF